MESADGAGRAGGDRDPYPRRTLWKSVSQPDAGRPSAEVPPWRRWTRGDLWAGVQRLLGFGVMRVSGPLRKADPEEAVRARARVKRARIREWYFYKQEICGERGQVSREGARRSHRAGPAL